MDRRLLVIFATTLMAVLGVASVAPALPEVARALDLRPTQVGLLITAFTLPGVLLSPLLGVAADRLGRRTVLVPSLLLFGLAGGACALAPGFVSLVALRFVQGVGAASLGMLNVTLIGDYYQGPRRSAVMGHNAAVLSLGTALYPAVGGLLAHLSWHWVFLLPLLSVPVALLAALTLPAQPVKDQRPLRAYLGAVVRRVAGKEAVAVFAVSLFTFVVLYGVMLTHLPLYLDHRFQLSPAIIGGLLSVGSLTTALVSTLMGRLSARFSHVRMILTACAFYAVALAGLATASRPLWLVPPMLLWGAGMGLNVPSLMTILAGLAPTEHRAAFLSVNALVLRLGQTLGPVVATAALPLGWKAPFAGGMLTVVLMAAILAAAGPSPRRAGGDRGSPTA